MPRRAAGGSWLGGATHYFVPKCCDQEPGLWSALPPTRGGADLWEMGRGEAQFCYLFHSFRCISTFYSPMLDRDMNQRMDGDEAENGEILNLIPILIFIADIENVSPCD